MPAHLSPHAKSVVAGLAATALAGVTAWQSLAAGHLRAADLLPVVLAVLGALQAHVVPTVPELPWAKAGVAGAGAVASAVATVVAQDPGGVTAAKVSTVALGAFLVWLVPEQTPKPPPPAPPAWDPSATQPMPAVLDAPGRHEAPTPGGTPA